MSDAPQRWITERLHDGMLTAYRADRVLYEEGTGHQHLVIYENAKFGRMMALDGVTQVTERDEFIYHEMLTHVPVLAHGAVRKLLIIGGGDGGMAREALRHTGIEKVTMVEIDKAVTDFCRKHLPMISAGAFDDPRLELVFDDGAAFVRSGGERYDVIIVDSTDPVGPGEVLFREEFYRNARELLADGGVIVTQNGVPFLQGGELKSTLAVFAGMFRSATCYLAGIPTYVGGPMGFGWGTDNVMLTEVSVETLKERFAAAGLKTRYYTPEVHKGAFALPPYVRRLLS